ncbi:hybrid sensor histidine kinase/response regulator transcription factor [Zobellia uliginosa]|uniref:hybrid sensor histidine kinase/response regulator transcription factor n=1 Tax=Zobellia uliginosa TaxID=143224 RepID=UPI0026E48630|nr:hybrid sensor histidine kinase/response regulator transcription factor [Zobellia uliginosa]MDO6518994.1 two-component regulator propeller domain-containing protein [Zobellia uliginosa]
MVRGILKIKFSNKIKTGLIAFLLLYISVGNSQVPMYKVGTLNDQNSINDNVVSSICKDSIGFIWIGKMDGLFRYSGYDAEVYSSSSNDKKRLSNPWVTDIIGYRHVLAIGTKRGLNFFNPKTGIFRRLFPSGTNSELSNEITSLLELPRGRLLVGTANGLILVASDTTSVLKEIPLFVDGVRNKAVRVRDMVQSSHGVFINTELGIFQLSEDSNSAHKLVLISGNQELNDIRSIYATKDHHLFISAKQGFFYFDIGLHRLTMDKAIQVSPIGELYSNWPPMKKVNVVLEDSNGAIWLGTEGNGVFSYNKQTAQWKNYRFEVDKKNVLKNDFIRALYEDESGMILVGSDAGVNTLIAEGGIFQSIENLTCKNIKEDVSNVHSILVDGNGRLWIGTRGNGLFVKDDGICINVHPDENGRLGQIRSIIEDESNRIWVGTQEGVYIIDSRDVKTENIEAYLKNVQPSLLPETEIYHILEDRVGNKWISTLSGLYIYTAEKNLRKITNTNIETILDKKVVYSMFLDSKERIWMGTLNGSIAFLDLKDYDNPYLFSEYIGKSLNFQRIAVAPSYKDYFENYGVYSLTEIVDGTILAGTNFGVCKIDIEKKQIAPLFSVDEVSTSSNLGNSYVYGLLYNKNQNQLWASSNNGLFSYDFNSREIENFGIKDGLQSLEFNGNAVHKDSQGKLYFGGANGLNIYDSALRFEKSSFKPNIALTKIFVNGKLLENDLKSKVLNNEVAYTRSLTLSSKQNTVGFEFTSLHLPYPLSNYFKCKLIGVDYDWIELKNKRSINYANLPKGKYSFQLMATNNDGVWSESPLTIHLEILPAWYNTWYMMLLWVLLSLTIIIVFVRVLIKNHNKNNALKIKEIEQENLQNLYESKLVFFTNLSHEIRTPLSLIVDPIKTLMSHREIYGRKPELFNVLNNNVDRLRRLIDQIMDFRKYEYGKLELDVVHADMVQTIRSITASFDFHSVQQKIRFKVKLPEHEMLMYFDEDKIEKIVYNILSNAFKATPAEGMVRISLRNFNPQKTKKLNKYKVICGNDKLKEFQNHIYIKVVDKGTGIRESNLEEIFTRFYQDKTINSGTGIGLYMVKQLTELHSGTILIKSKRHKGTSFIIVLPRNEDIYSTSIVDNQPLVREGEELEGPGTLILRGTENNIIKDKTHSIAIVEDNDELRMYLKDILEGHYHVFTATNGVEGLELIKDEIPDLVLSDVVMPEMDGLELCRYVKNNFDTSHIPIILLTAKTFDSQKLSGLQSGADVYLTKPFNREIVLANIANLIKGREKLRLIFQNEKILEPSRITVSSVDETLMLKLKKYIEEHVQDQNLTLEHMATEIGVSRAQLFRKMKALTGLTPNNFIKSVRLKFAVQLLEENKLQISEVALLCGFKEPSYFSRCFRETYGCTPKEYMKS